MSLWMYRYSVDSLKDIARGEPMLYEPDSIMLMATV